MDGKAQQTYNDPLYSDQYYHRLIMANRLNNFPMIDNTTADGRTIVVAVVENGININSTDVNWYKNQFEISNNNIDDDNNGYIDDYDGWRSEQMDDNFTVITGGIHGENCSGIIGSFANNNTGCVGVAPSVSILPVQGGSKMVEALEYVLAQRLLYNQTNGAKGAFVVACNLSFEFYTNICCTVIEDLYNAGVIVVCAAGNDMLTVVSENESGDHSYPTSCNNIPSKIISVGGSNKFDCRGRYKPTSHKGSDEENEYADIVTIGSDKGTNQSQTFIHVVAPSEDIVSIDDTDPDQYSNGTSFAAPQVTALVALVYDVLCESHFYNVLQNPTEIAQKVRNLIFDNAEMPPYGKLSAACKHGRINVYKTLLNSMKAVNVQNNLVLSNITLSNKEYIARNNIEITNCTLSNPNIQFIAGNSIIANSENILQSNCILQIDNDLTECSIGDPELSGSLSGEAWGVCAPGVKRFYIAKPLGGKEPYHFNWVLRNSSGTAIIDYEDDDVDRANFVTGSSGNGLFLECTITDALGNSIVVKKEFNCLLSQSMPIEEDIPQDSNLARPLVNQNHINILPNPANEIINFSSDDYVKCIVTSSSGNIVKTFEFTIEYTYDISELSNGLYYFNCIGKQYHEIQKIIINH